MPLQPRTDALSQLLVKDIRKVLLTIATAGAIVGLVGGVAGILALFVQWSAQLEARRANLRRHAAAVLLRRVDGKVLLRNGGADRLFKVVVEADIDPALVPVPVEGWARDDFHLEVAPARVLVGDVAPTSPSEEDRVVDVVATRGLPDMIQDQLPPESAVQPSREPGPWSQARATWSPRPQPFVPAALQDDEVIDMVGISRRTKAAFRNAIAEVRAKQMGKEPPTPETVPTIEFTSPVEEHYKREAYEHFATVRLDDPKNVVPALVNLSVTFTDVAGRRWRRYEEGTIELLGPLAKWSRFLRLPRTYRDPSLG